MQAVNGIGEQCHQYFSPLLKRLSALDPSIFSLANAPWVESVILVSNTSLELQH